MDALFWDDVLFMRGTTISLFFPLWRPARQWVSEYLKQASEQVARAGRKTRVRARERSRKPVCWNELTTDYMHARLLGLFSGLNSSQN